MRWYEPDIECEQQQAELEDQATRLIRTAERAERRRPVAHKSSSPEPLLPNKGWVKLQDLRRALQAKANRL
jgi:hypothetical protein